MNYCIDCKHFNERITDAGGMVCEAVECADPVDGSPTAVRFARINICNKDGSPQFWKAKNEA